METAFPLRGLVGYNRAGRTYRPDACITGGTLLSQEQAHVSQTEQEETATLPDAYGVAGHHGEEEEHIHLPGPSYWPILVAAAMALTLVGLMIDIGIAAVGLLLAFIFGVGWGLNWGLEGQQQAPVE